MPRPITVVAIFSAVTICSVALPDAPCIFRVPLLFGGLPILSVSWSMTAKSYFGVCYRGDSNSAPVRYLAPLNFLEVQAALGFGKGRRWTMSELVHSLYLHSVNRVRASYLQCIVLQAVSELQTLRERARAMMEEKDAQLQQVSSIIDAFMTLGMQQIRTVMQKRYAYPKASFFKAYLYQKELAHNWLL